MAETLTIASLIPERNNVDFGKGKVFEVLSMTEMDATEYAGFARMQSRAEGLQESISDTSDPEEAGQVMTDLNGLLGELLKTLMPDLDDTTLGDTKLGIRVGILDWWNKQNERAPKALGQESQS